MNNTELELKIKEIISQKNFFDMIIQAKQFEKDYKDSEFYKITKINLLDILKDVKLFYSFQIDEIIKSLQEKINSLDLSNIDGLMDKVASIFGAENQEFATFMEEFKDNLSELREGTENKEEKN